MNVIPSFDKTLLGSTQSKVNTSHWDTVLDHWEKKQYRDCVLAVFDYVDPAIAQKYSNADKTQFSVPHGSIVVNVTVDQSHFSVNAPFLAMPEGAKVPLMRQVAQINFSPLNLASISLRDNHLEFEYSCPLDTCEPYKVYDVLREICLYGDTYDDEFISKFGASRLREPVITRYSQQQLDQVWNKIQQYISEANQYVEYFEGKRLPGFSWDIISVTLRKIEYYASPQGYLRTEIERAINEMGSEASLHEKVSKGREFLNKLAAMDRSRFDEEMYMVETFIPYKWKSNLDNIKQNFQYAFDTSAKEISNNDHIGASLTILFAFYNLHYNNNVQDDVAVVVENAMSSAAGKTWQEGSGILRKALENIMNGNLTVTSEPQRASKGFLAGLFGRK